MLTVELVTLQTRSAYGYNCEGHCRGIQYKSGYGVVVYKNRQLWY